MFKKKLITLSAAAGVLALVYAVTFIFDNERSAERSAAYVWLSRSQAERSTRIELHSSAPDAASVFLERTGEKWNVAYDNGKVYPARHDRVGLLIAALDTSGGFSVQGKSRDIQEKLSVTDSQSARITVAADNETLVSLIIGAKNASGSNISLRKIGEDTVRSGEDRFSRFTESARTYWSELRIWTPPLAGKLDAADAQRFTVYPMADEGAPSSYTLVRDGAGWKAETRPASAKGEPDTGAITTFLKNIAEAGAEDFAPEFEPEDVEKAAAARVVLETGDGSVRTLYLILTEDERYVMSISGVPYAWYLAQWTVSRIFNKGDELFSEPKES